MSVTSLLFLIFLLKHCLCESCVCVPFWKCNDDNMSDEYFDNFYLGNECKGHFDVCCKVKCGQRKTDNLPFADVTRARILGKKNEANFGEFPWMLGILHDNTYRCGASLIHPKVALTAAHCVQAKGAYKIRAGEWDWDSAEEPLRHQDRTARKIIIHPKYDPRSLANDIALVIVQSAFQLTDHIGVACLPKQRFTAADKCVVTGWGKTSHSEQKFQPVLNHAVLPLVDRNECTRALQRAQFGLGFRLHESFICAGGGKSTDTCKGDGGSPLICSIQGETDRYEQIGIVSWGLVCGVTDCPGVYVNVALFTEWIEQQMRKHNFNTPYKY